MDASRRRSRKRSTPLTDPGREAPIADCLQSAGRSAESTTDLVHSIRICAPLITETGASVPVTGLTATKMNTFNTLSAALIPYLALVVGLALVLLLLVLDLCSSRSRPPLAIC